MKCRKKIRPNGQFMHGHREYLETLVEKEVTNTGPIQITGNYDSILLKLSENTYQMLGTQF